MKILFNGVFGSHLYGLSRPQSDTDYKGLFVPTLEDVVFGNFQPVIEKQTDDIDTSLYAIGKYFSMLDKGDTVSVDMIHTPKEFTLNSTPAWDEIQKNRSGIYCKNMRGILGYIKTMSTKYGHKVRRYQEMQELNNWLHVYHDSVRVAETTIPEQIMRSDFKYITFTPHKDNIIANIDICGSRNQITCRMEHLKTCLEQKISRYGDRTVVSSHSGGDWKALSHAVRAIIQLEEIIDTRDLVFPLVRADEIMKIKLGQVPQEDAVSIITDMYDSVTEKLEASDLPEYNDMSKIKDIIMEEYNG